MAEIIRRIPVCDDSEHGERGERGERGHRGHRGHDGSTGPTGSTGPAGSTSPGSSGPTGPTGATGATGPTGAANAVGARFMLPLAWYGPTGEGDQIIPCIAYSSTPATPAINGLFDVVAVRDGSVVGLSLYNAHPEFAQPSAGTLTYNVLVNDVVVSTISLVITQANANVPGIAVTQAPGIDTFSAGDRIGVQINQQVDPNDGSLPIVPAALMLYVQIQET